MHMPKVKVRLDAWRDAERRRDGLAPGSSEYQDAEDDVRSAEKAFHAEFAQASARYAEAELQGSRWAWAAQLDLRTTRAAD